MNLIFLGDFFYDYHHIQKDIQNIADWINENEAKVILNLEGPLYSSSQPVEKRGSLLCQSGVTIEILKKLNVVGVCLANNHIMDYGGEALENTITTLKESGIAFTGAGKNISEALQPMRITLEGQEVIIQNFGWDIEETIYATETEPGCAPRDERLIVSKTRELRKDNMNAKIINVFHWGFEYNLLPMPLDAKLAHDSIDAGCDLIIGHHPHNLQPHECYNNKPIYYSLGNFYFSTKRKIFSEKKFPFRKENLCDYGGIVNYDIITQEYNHKHLIVYDKKTNSSYVKENNPDMIENATNKNMFSNKYLKNVKKNSINYNPILTLDEKKNIKKLKRLKNIYKITGYLKSMNSPTGKKVIVLFKKMYKNALKR